jgi:hypothetical protein
MPRAVNIQNGVRYDLKTLPPVGDEAGGFVVILRLNQGQKMERQGLTNGMKFKANRSKDFEGELAMANQRVTEYEFAHCVGEHNLTNEEGQPLDFSKLPDLRSLDGKVGEEISRYIDKENQFTEDDDTGE